MGAESECFRWISRENHFSLIAVGSERLRPHSLQFKTDLRQGAKLPRHDELAPMGIYANEVGRLLPDAVTTIYLSCESEISRLGSGMHPLNLNEST